MTQAFGTRERLAEVLTGRPIDVDTRVRIQVAYVDAGGPGADVPWDELPEDVRDLVEAAEVEPASASTDPYGSHRWANALEGLSPQGVMWHRMNDAVGAHEYGTVPHMEEIGEAWGDSDGTWDGLPDHIRTAIEQIETFLPRTAWDDPADVPEFTDYLDRLDDEPGADDTSDELVQTDDQRGPYVLVDDAAGPPES